MELSELKSKIRDIKDFPTEGVLFKDITTLLKEPQAFKYVVTQLALRYIQERVELIVLGGFILFIRLETLVLGQQDSLLY